MISLSVDGHPVEVESGASVLDAARKAGARIPTLCHQDDLSPFGACRLCIVEIEGRRGYPASCATRAEEGMVVRTDTEPVQEFRKQVLELLLSEHPSSCLVCSDRLTCWESHECTGRAEITTGCKFCPSHTRCELEELVEEIWGKEGAEIRLPSRYRNIPVERRDPFIDLDHNLCILCGRCIRACAELKLNYTLEFVYRGSEERVGTPFNRPLADSGCLFCGACVEACPTGALSERVRRWEGAAEGYVATTCSYCGTGCQLELGVKEGSVIEALPRKDEGNDACLRGRFAVVELVRSVRRLKSPMVRRDGQLIEVPWETALEAAAEGIKAARSDRSALLYSGSCTNEDIYLAHRFARDVLETPHVDSSLRLSYGPLLDAGRALGPTARLSELEEAAAVLITGADPSFSHPVLALQLKRAVHEGRTRLVLMGPHGTNLSGSAACEIRHAPGEEQQALEQLQQALSDGGADLPEAVGRAAEILRDAESVVVAFGSGLTRRLNGTANLDALSRLAEGLEARLLPLFTDANDHGAREIAASFDRDGLTAPEILHSAADGELDLLYFVGQDALPGSSEKSFVVVQDTFLSPGVAEIADVVLPAASFAEIDGSTTNMYGQVRRVRQAIQPLGTSKPDWQILSILAGKLGADGFEYADASKVMSELARSVPFYKGASYASLEKGKPFFGKTGAAGKGKQKRAAAAREAGGRRPVSEKPDHDYPLVLVAELDEFTYKATPLSSQVPGLRRLERAPAVMVNPRDADALGVGDGAPVSVISRRGRVAANTQLSPDTREGVVRMVIRAGESSPAPLLQGLLDPTSKTPDELCAVRIEKL